MATVGGGQPQQLCDKIHTHFNWNGANKAIKQENMQKSRKYFQWKNAIYDWKVSVSVNI